MVKSPLLLMESDLNVRVINAYNRQGSLLSKCSSTVTLGKGP